ncbi:hypothetical protein TNCV_2451551 [Trichonephila clavipes]|nr:hypothetical protein TNCV_2451551 [Trichonephila clavipes]
MVPNVVGYLKSLPGPWSPAPNAQWIKAIRMEMMGDSISALDKGSSLLGRIVAGDENGVYLRTATQESIGNLEITTIST